MALPENRLGLIESSVPIGAVQDPESSTAEAAQTQAHIKPGVQEWPAHPKGTIEVQDSKGGTETITFTEWYSRLGISNRAGT